MGENDRGRIELQRALDHHARMDGGTGDGAVKQLFATEQAVAVVEKERHEDFVFALSEEELQVRYGLLGVAEHRASPVTRCQKGQRKLDDGALLTAVQVCVREGRRSGRCGAAPLVAGTSASMP
jgi:hypothetical protein